MMEIPMMTMEQESADEINTLKFFPGRCVRCGRCWEVCPHAVFAPSERKARLVAPERCMECGACKRNCPTEAISVDEGVGCASAMIKAALTGSKEVTCGPECCR